MDTYFGFKPVGGLNLSVTFRGDWESNGDNIMSFTFAELKTAIQDYTENSETTFVNNLPLFIKNAEQRIHESVQLEFFRRNVTTNMTIWQIVLNAPSDYLASYSMSITNAGSKIFLDNKDVNYLEERPNSSTTGTPRLCRI